MITLKSKKEKNNIFVLKEKNKEVEGVLTLKFLPAKGAVFSFKPGQFVLVSFLDNRLDKQYRAYSISSCPQDKFLALTIKKLGTFSSALHGLKISGKVKVNALRGDFYLKKSMGDLVFWLAASALRLFIALLKIFILKVHKRKSFYFIAIEQEKTLSFLKN
jgi:ferredoxin-NADP reductase